MNTRSFNVEAESNGQGGFNAIVLDKSKIGFNPAQTFSSVQVSCVGLDGGTYSVHFLPVHGDAYVDFETGVAQNNAVLMSKGFVLSSLKVDFANLGGSAVPKATITFIKRSF
tara:strand:+ start:3804 stop:4139 length:336 start_codon:yes stop_codon:yes gene_type:complete